jgi:hypothetical protein
MLPGYADDKLIQAKHIIVRRKIRGPMLQAYYYYTFAT